MVGTPVDGQLSGADTGTTRAGVRFAVATPADDAAIRRLLRDNPMTGAVTLSFEREPDYFRGAGIAGAEDRIIVAYAGERLICIGRCSVRECWLNGAPRRVGYLAELRLDASAAGRFDVLRNGYRFFHESHRLNPADFHFTSIAADNARARRLLERELPGMPRYEFLGGLTTLLVSTRSVPSTDVRLEQCPAAEIADFLNEIGSRENLSATWSAEKISGLVNHDLPLGQFGIHREAGRIVAASALWDQRQFRQTVVRGYTRGLTIARPVMNFFAPLFGKPSLPAPGGVLAHVFLSPLAIRPERSEILPGVVAAVARRATQRGADFLTLALPADDPRVDSIRRRFRCRTYASRLYRVAWPGDPVPALDGRPLVPDVALL